ncbi:MAG: hypothetical protein AB7F86_10010 [Bdellovibrionales bacterium]
MQKKHSMFFSALLLLTSCTTLDQSFRLGAGLGAATGAAAVYASHANGSPPSLENVATGAGIGLGIGLITSYFVHSAVTQDRQALVQQTKMQFGDLPPSPFVFPETNNKGGR